MKKIHILITLALMAVFGLMSCGHKTEIEKKADSVAEKIDKGEPLTELDYNVMIQYVGDFAQKAQPFDDSIINEKGIDDAQRQLDSLKEKYPLVDKFRNSIHDALVADLGPDNVTLINHFGHYIEFTIPAGMSVGSGDFGVGGMEVATPPAGDSNGVIAGGIDTVENEI